MRSSSLSFGEGASSIIFCCLLCNVQSLSKKCTTFPKSQNEIYLNGWSLEARLYAEDINKNFLPQSGCLRHLKFPKISDHPNCIIDTGSKKGDFISPYYDPMIAKIISHGKNRKEAINHLRNCLFDIEVAGITTNLNLSLIHI